VLEEAGHSAPRNALCGDLREVGSAKEWAELQRRLSLVENALREIQRIAGERLKTATALA
jgi:hypothetical protein